jgi:Cu-processing system permease protein
MRAVAVVFGYALRESLRRRVFHAGLLLTALFLGLYGLGCSLVPHRALHPSRGVPSLIGGIDVVVAGTILGLAVFATYFLGVALAIFLTISVVRGDAESGLLQPLIVRPVSRLQLLLGRFAAAFAVSGAYVVLVYATSILITREAIGWMPRDVVPTAAELLAAVAVVAALGLLGSIYLSSVANGIGIFMLFGAGLFGGLLGEIGRGIGSHRLQQVSEVIGYLMPFEWLYQDALGHLIGGERGLTKTVLNLGPFGGSVQAGAAVWVWSLAYFVLTSALAGFALARRDL